MSRFHIAAVAVAALTAVLGCGGPSQLTPREHRQAEVRWEARFGPNAGSGSRAPFALSADARGDAVDVTVHAHRAGATFVDWSLGARLFTYLDGRWQEAGSAGSTLPAERVLERGQTVRVHLEANDDASRHRAVVRFLRDGGSLAAAWVDVTSR